MSNYRRLRVLGGSYFFTVNLANRRQKLLTQNIDILRKGFRKVRKAHPFHIDAIVILPDHLHCIWTLSEGDDDYSMRWRQIKSAFSSELPGVEKRSDSRVKKRERGIWQRRFWEHLIRGDKEYARLVDYIHFNPVKHGHAETPGAWPYSSFRKHVKMGIYPSNWIDDSCIKELDYD
ncbi:MAG: transposase [Pseudomonadota bacterium]